MLLLLAATALEDLRLQSLAHGLPGAAGGLLGSSVAPWLAQALGGTGASVALIVACALGASLAFGFSWLSVAEHLGAAMERLVNGVRALREANVDRSIGETASEERAAALAAQRERLEEHEPVHIERSAAHAPVSDRKQKEAQVPLFAELATPLENGLPALGLLDEAERAGSGFDRYAGIYLAPDREEAQGLRRRGVAWSRPLPAR